MPTAPLRVAFERSCNTAFVQLGIRLGADAIRTTADAFGFDAPPPPIPLQVAGYRDVKVEVRFDGEPIPAG